MLYDMNIQYISRNYVPSFNETHSEQLYFSAYCYGRYISTKRDKLEKYLSTIVNRII